MYLFKSKIMYPKKEIERIDIEEINELLRKLREDWSDEIPNKILRSTDSIPSPQYKVRRAWFQVLYSTLNAIRRLVTLNDHLKIRVEEFTSRVTSEDFRVNLTKKEDIDLGNDLIDEARRFLFELLEKIE